MRRMATILVVPAALLLPVLPAAADGENERTINVTGEGTATSPPDMATINTGVQTQAGTAEEALDANNQAMEGLLDVLEDHGIAEKDVQTTSFNVHPIHEQDQRGRTQPAIVAYRVVNQVKVEVRNLPRLGEALDALVRAGSNRISGVSFGVDDSTGVLDQARNRAIGDARRRANLYAQAAGVKVGKLLRISEQPVQIPTPRRLDYARAAGAEASRVPVATGEQEFRATIHVVFALEDAD